MNFPELLRKEIDNIQMSQYFGLECDSDEELQDESDEEYYSEDESLRKTVDYDIDKMFEIIKCRDFNKWSLSHIHNRYKKIDGGPNGRMQLSR